MRKIEHRLWMGCLLTGVITLGLAVFILPMFPSDSARDVSAYGGPVYAFEFARSASDLVAIFGTEGDPEKARRLAMMDRGNRWDFLFMSAYTLFGILFGFAMRKTAPGLGSRLIAVAIIAGIADMMETRTLLSMTEDLRAGIAGPAGLHDLWRYVTVKFAALAVSVLTAGLFLFSMGSKFWKVAGVIVAMAALMTVPALFQPDRFGVLLGLSIGTGWVVMLAYAAVQVKSGVNSD